MRRSIPVGSALATILFLLVVPAAAQTGIDAQENLFGATNIAAVTGHGGLTVGVSHEGDLSVLSWPNPSYADQLAYRTLNGIDARSKPRFGAPASAGVVLGMVVTTADGTQVAWLRDWSHTVGYGADAGPNPTTTYTHAELGLVVVVVDAVDPDVDGLVRRVTVTRTAESPVTGASLLTYANFSPQPPTSRVPELPVVDWIKDGENDFAALWDEARGAVVHFHPDDQRVYGAVVDLAGSPMSDWGPVGEALQGTTIEASTVAGLVSDLDDDYGPGAFVTLSTLPPPDQHQVGFDATGWCDQLEELLENMKGLTEVFPSFKPPIDPETAAVLLCKQRPDETRAEQGWTFTAEDPFVDAGDGELSGAGIAAGEVAEALRTPLAFDGDEATAAVVLGLGRTYADARANLPTDVDGVVTRARDTVAAWADTLRIPGTPGDRVHAVARRSLINLRVGTDRERGAVVASIARQPPYALDWPRDGAFFNVMLDASGQPQVVDQRAELYTSWQRPESVPATFLIDPDPPLDPRTGLIDGYPADAWEMNYYADGMPGGTFRFEIDTTAFAIWAAVAHVGWADDPDGHLQSQWPTIRRGAELLAAWRDEATGLHAPAQEDDAAAYTQTLHGAITVFGALDLAARAARKLGEDDDAQRWEDRARELRDAMRANFYDEAEGVFEMTGSERLPILASGLVPVGPTAWLVWPMPLYAYEDEVMQRQLRRDYGIIKPVLDLETPGGLYYMKNTISIAVGGRGDLPAIADGLPPILADEATPDTEHFGEVMVVVEEDGVKRPDQRVSTPHLWEGTLFYLTALAAEDPGALTAYDAYLPPSRVLADQEDEGCSCRIVGAPGPEHEGAAWLAAWLVAAIYRRRRSR